jgi:aspartyl protease family protein
MGFTRVKVSVSHPIELERSAEVELLVDAGALNSVVPRETLQKLGVPSQYRRRFRMANGQDIERDVGLAFFKWNDHMSGAPVVFGEPDDMPLLGVTALEAMGLQVDPVTNELKHAESYLL